MITYDEFNARVFKENPVYNYSKCHNYILMSDVFDYLCHEYVIVYYWKIDSHGEIWKKMVKTTESGSKYIEVPRAGRIHLDKFVRERVTNGEEMS